MEKIKSMTQGTEEWLKFRKGHVTATDIAPIVGVSPWDATAYTLFFDKKSDEVVPKQSKYLEWGSRLEPIIIDKVVEELGITNVERGSIYVDDWKMASLDGEGELNGEHIVIEAKTTSHRDGWWDENGNESIPLHYQLQAMWQMVVTGYRKVVFTVLCCGSDWWTRTIEWDEEMAKEILISAEWFIKHLGDNEPPRATLQKYAQAAEAERKLRQQKEDEKNTKREVEIDVIKSFIYAMDARDAAERNLSNVTNLLLEKLDGAKVAVVKDIPYIKMQKSGKGYKYVILNRE